MRKPAIPVRESETARCGDSSPDAALAPADSLIARIRAGERALHEARELLLTPTPDNLDACLEPIERAFTAWRGIDPAVTAGITEIESAAKAFGRELADVRRLLEQASSHYLGCVEALRASAGYGADGTIGVVAASGGSLVEQG